MIRHTVMFTLKHESNSREESEFLIAALALETIESVRKFERLRQTSAKCNHRFGFSMEFESREGYEFYNNHPTHTKFVEDYWIPEVADFQEIDYELYQAQ
ncbi:MAG: Dabb family protein [Mariniblastus sp.]|nr:Dabb family protein [Mariniblastus sp.]